MHGKEYDGSRVEFEQHFYQIQTLRQTTGKIESETARYLSAASAISDRRYDRYAILRRILHRSDVLISAEFPPGNSIQIESIAIESGALRVPARVKVPLLRHPYFYSVYNTGSRYSEVVKIRHWSKVCFMPDRYIEVNSGSDTTVK